MFKSDHFLVILEVALSGRETGKKKLGSLKFFRVNMDLALSATGSAGVREILKRWHMNEVEPSEIERTKTEAQVPKIAAADSRREIRKIGRPAEAD